MLFDELDDLLVEVSLLAVTPLLVDELDDLLVEVPSAPPPSNTSQEVFLDNVPIDKQGQITLCPFDTQLHVHSLQDTLRFCFSLFLLQYSITTTKKPDRRYRQAALNTPCRRKSTTTKVVIGLLGLAFEPYTHMHTYIQNAQQCTLHISNASDDSHSPL